MEAGRSACKIRVDWLLPLAAGTRGAENSLPALQVLRLSWSTSWARGALLEQDDVRPALQQRRGRKGVARHRLRAPTSQPGCDQPINQPTNVPAEANLESASHCEADLTRIDKMTGQSTYTPCHFNPQYGPRPLQRRGVGGRSDHPKVRKRTATAEFCMGCRAIPLHFNLVENWLVGWQRRIESPPLTITNT